MQLGASWCSKEKGIGMNCNRSFHKAWTHRCIGSDETKQVVGEDSVIFRNQGHLQDLSTQAHDLLSTMASATISCDFSIHVGSPPDILALQLLNISTFNPTQLPTTLALDK